MCGSKVCTKTIVYEAVILYSQHTIWQYYNCENVNVSSCMVNISIVNIAM